MGERRALIKGLDAIEGVDPQLAEDFILNRKPRKTPKIPAPAPKVAKQAKVEPADQPPAPHSIVAAETVTPSPLTGVGRVPVGARVRTELAAALKRASLERQLQGIQPNSVQEILEESLELWLLKHGHLK